MRKVVLTQFAISLDGYICEEDTEFYQLWRQIARAPRAASWPGGPSVASPRGSA